MCVLHGVERHCVCTAQCRVALCVLHSVERHAHTVPLYTVQYTRGASLDCAVHTKFLSRMKNKDEKPIKIF